MAETWFKPVMKMEDLRRTELSGESPLKAGVTFC